MIYDGQMTGAMIIDLSPPVRKYTLTVNDRNIEF